MVFCKPDDRSCVNQRVYFISDYRRPSPYDKPEAAEASTTVAPPPPTPASEKPRAPVRIAPLKPNVQDLTQAQINKARMVKASRIAYTDDFEAAQTYLDEQSIPYDIDTTLSSKDGLVLVGDDGVTIAYRGTEIRNPVDLSADAMIAVGVEENHPQFKTADEQFKLVQEKYGSPNELVGYSLGGTKAMTLGNKHGIDTTTFNAFTGKNLLASESTATHNVIRTTEDFATLGIGLAGGKKNWEVSSILPHQDKINPIEAHKLSNFTEQSVRRPGHTDTLLRAAAHEGVKRGELELIDAIKVAQEKGLSFTEFVHEFNGKKGQDTLPDGSALAGSRMHRDSKWVKYWNESKGEGSSAPAFTPAEESHFDSIPEQESTYKPAIRPKERESFRQKTAEARAEVIQDAHTKLIKVTEAVDTHTNMHKASASAIKRAVHPVNLGIGLGGGLAAGALMDDVIDRDHKIVEPVRIGVEGAAAGAITEMGAAALVGSALSAGTMGVGAAAGGASYLAGAGASKLTTSVLESAHASKDVSEGVGATVGGGVGGGVGAAAAIGGAALMGAEIGEFGGPVGLALGTGIGSVIGAAGWLIGKMGGR
jgi:hypothetical protein